MKKTQTFSHNDLEKLQEDKLKKILLHSINNISAYQQYKNLENEINNNPKKALLKINILDKATFKNNEEKFLDQRKNKSELILNSTGGSTGQPTKFYMDRHTVEFYEAARWRGLSWHNIEIGDSSAMIWGSPIELSKNAKIKYKLKDRFLKNRIVVSAYEINENCVKKYVKLFNKFKPVYFYGYASAIYVFAQIMTKLNLSLKKNPIAVICTAETIHDYQRELIEKNI